MNRMASAPDAMARNPHVVFTKISHVWEEWKEEKVTRALAMDLGISFYLQE